MKRLRSRLVAAFLGVAILAIIPLVVVPYLTLQARNKNARTSIIDGTYSEIQTYINTSISQPSLEVLIPLARYMRDIFKKRPYLLEILEETESMDDIWAQNQLRDWERNLWNQVEDNWKATLALRTMKPDRQFVIPIKIIPKQPYLKMKEWMDQNLFYEEEGNLYCFSSLDLIVGDRREEQRLVGGLFLKTALLIYKDPNNPERNPILNIRNTYDPAPYVFHPNPNLFEHYLDSTIVNRLFLKDNPIVQGFIDIPRFQVDENDKNWHPLFRNTPMQVKLIPFYNQNRELSAIMVLGYPIISIFREIGLSIIIGYIAMIVIIIFAALLFDRSLSKPIIELVAAAREMSNANFDIRVNPAGTEELQVLGSAFNQLAERIQFQMAQLQQKSAQLELSNRELSQTQRFLENILSNIQTGVLSIDRDGIISHINQVGINVLHISTWVGLSIFDIISCPAFKNLVKYSLKQGCSVSENEIPFQRSNNQIIPLQVSTVPLLESGHLTGLVVTFHDLSAIRKLEEQLRRQDRLAALGRMAAGVAHEIRNPLSIIRGSAEILKKRFGHLEDEQGLSDFILDEVKRLSLVVNDFLMFARPPIPNKEEIRIDELFRDLIAYFDKQSIDTKFNIVHEVQTPDSTISADLKLCRQVFLNLVINAQQAMPDGGTITLRARTASIDSEVYIEVIDEGIGIHPEQLDKIFDPFYTSKDSGTGLGLSLVHQIVSSHGGRIEVESIPGKGSIFRLIFPTYESIEKTLPAGPVA